MSPALPEGEAIPDGGPLAVRGTDPAAGSPGGQASDDVARDGGRDTPGRGAGGRTAARDFGVYVHVPFCASRCGYCDFNTYTAAEVGAAPGPGGRDLIGSWAETARAEIRLAARELAEAGVPARAVSTVFFGGGTPTLLPAGDLVAVLREIDATWGLAPGAEVTTEANPDSVDAAGLEALAAGGFTRVSLGMQSADLSVLATLERTHDPAGVARAHAAARSVGLATSLDLIYGTPGESPAQWRASLEAACALGPDHVSAYALTIEPGTRMGVALARGAIEAVDGDDQAAKYETADRLLTEAGYAWYEISNWARTPGDRCRHNLGYWRSQDWWGVGPGAHSYLGAGAGAGPRPVRWWNVKHPRAWSAALAAGRSPAAGRELLGAQADHMERVMLGVRLAEGLALGVLSPSERSRVPDLVRRGLLEAGPLEPGPLGVGRLVPTLTGRLLSDTLVADLLD